MGKMDIANDSDYAVVWSQNRVIFAGPLVSVDFGQNCTAFTFKGAESDMSDKRDFVVIWDQIRKFVIFQDDLGRIMMNAASWVEGDIEGNYLEWDETPEDEEADILFQNGIYAPAWGIMDKLDNIAMSDSAVERYENALIAQKLTEYLNK